MGIDKNWNSGGGHEQRSGSPGHYDLPDLMMGLVGVATIAALKALDATQTNDGAMYRVAAAGGQQLVYKYVAASALTGDDLLVLAPADGRAAGRFVFVGSYIDLSFAVDHTTADAAVLYTVPTGFQLQVGVPWWHVDTSFTGGASSAIGLSSSNAGLSTAGDLLGGASGDLAATLASTGPYAQGTVGAKIGKPAALLVAGDTIKFNRIASNFTAGAGSAHVPVFPIATP